MKTPKAALLVCLTMQAGGIASLRADDTTVGGEKTDPAEDIAFFANGDTLHGAMAGCDKEGLHWQTVYDQHPVTVTTKFLTEIRLHPRKSPDNAQQPANEVILFNGDVLPGTVVSFNGKSFLVDTWYAGRLTIPRAEVSAVTASAVIYEGPVDMNGWVADPAPGQENTWTCVDGVLGNSGLGSVGRDMKLPPLARIQFNINLPSTPDARVNIYFCADRPSSPGSYYVLQVDAQSETVGLVHYSRETTITNIGESVALDGRRLTGRQTWNMESDDGWQAASPLATPPPKATGDSTHFDIRINRETKTIRLYINGVMVNEYAHLDDLPKSGGALIFSSLKQGSPVRIAKIQVGAWSGEPDDGDGGEKHGVAPDADVIEVANRDSVSGKLKEIANGKAVVASAQGDVEIPLAQVESIRLSSDAAAPRKIRPGDVRAQLLVRGRVTMHIETWDAKQVVATSPDFGRAVFSSDAFKKLEFNLDNPRPVPVAPAQPSPTPSPPGVLILKD